MSIDFPCIKYVNKDKKSVKVLCLKGRSWGASIAQWIHLPLRV